VKNILIISTTGMGDCLWATPGIRALKKSFPDVALDIVIQPRWESLYYGNPHIRRLIPYKPQWYYQLTLLSRLWRTNYDHILIFHANKDIGRLISYLRYSKIWAHQNLPKISSHQILKFTQAIHPIFRRAAILEKLGVMLNGTKMEIFLNDSDRAEAIHFLKKNQMNVKEFIYFNIGASLPHKRWHNDRMVALANLFLKNTSLGIVLGGGSEDAPAIEKIERKINSKRITHAFHRPLRANCALIDQACLMITTDTGPMHVAFATGTPTIALFGPTRPEDSGPCEIDPKLCQVIQATALNNLSHDPADINIFFDSITVDMVWDKANLLLSQ